MATATTSLFQPKMPPGYSTMADLLEQLGGIPAYRIWLKPAPGEATEADAIFIEDHYGRLCELVDGTLVEKDMGVFESRLAIVLGHFLESFLDDRDLGAVFGADAMFRLFPKQVRIPDVSFISWKRMPNQELPDEKVSTLIPDLAVEVLSEGNTAQEMDRKLKEYFLAGCKVVWYVDPADRTVRVYSSPRKWVLLTDKDVLDGGRVLPGFSLPIKKWFARASRRPRK